MEETILEGHLGVTKELLAFQTQEKKYYIGCEKGGANLIKVQHSDTCIKKQLDFFIVLSHKSINRFFNSFSTRS